MKKLTGTAENFMHAHYLVEKICGLNSEAENALSEEHGGEDGLVMELIPYGLILGCVIDEIFEEKEDFPGVPAYEISDGAAGVWLFEYLMKDNKFPTDVEWCSLCTNLVRAWCQQDLEVFMTLDRQWQVIHDQEKVGVVKLCEDVKQKEEPPRLPNGQVINVANVEKLIEGTGISLDRAIATLEKVPRGTQFVNFNNKEMAFWRCENGQWFYYGNTFLIMSDDEHLTGSWCSISSEPSNPVEYEKTVLSTVFEGQNLEQEVAMALESEEIQPDREIKKPVVTEVRSAVQHFGLEIVSEGNKITVNQGDFEVVLIDGKFTKIGDTELPV